MTSGIAPRCGIGFASLLDEVSRAPLTFTGTVPLILAGTMYRIGPGRFQIGDHAVGHWLDGFALVSSITLSTGGATFSNRFLGSSWY
ncbi:MAG TPA: carotenoid oxygenase family protein, partial [Clostridia bacterium]|nr:carotenoid oxygenase family protein [Clostridia bacterium]